MRFEIGGEDRAVLLPGYLLGGMSHTVLIGVPIILDPALNVPMDVLGLPKLLQALQAQEPLLLGVGVVIYLQRYLNLMSARKVQSRPAAQMLVNAREAKGDAYS